MEEESLRRRGIDVSFRMEEAALAGVEVKALLRQDPEVLRPGDSYAVLVERFLRSHRQRLFVVDEQGRLEGAVSLHDIKHLLQEPSAVSARVAHDLAVPVDNVLFPATRLHRFAQALDAGRSRRATSELAAGGRARERRSYGVLASGTCLRSTRRKCYGAPGDASPPSSPPARPAGRATTSSYRPTSRWRLVPVPRLLHGRTLAEAYLPQRFGVRVIG